MAETFLVQQTVETTFIKLCQEIQKKIPHEIQKRRKKVLIIAGPTCVGKSELALELAKKIGGEIVSCDSMQVYRGMNIGTAKPSLEERLEVPHHLIDTRELHEDFNVVAFYREASLACQQIHERKNIPILVGGSGFYIHSFLYGPPEGPPPDRELRKKLEGEIESAGSEKMYERLESLDPEYAKTITPHDKHKIVRALEIIETSNKKVSSLSWNRRYSSKWDARCWFFSRPRESLYYRINKRCEKMLEQGFIQEIEELLQKGLKENRTASQSIGYRQGLDYLQSKKAKEDYAQFLEAFKKATRHYAKRQITWFKKEPLFHWLDLDLHDPETILDIIISDFECWQWEL